MDAGLGTQLSDVDEIVFGRDLDFSNDAVKDVRQARAFRGAQARLGLILPPGACERPRGSDAAP